MAYQFAFFRLVPFFLLAVSITSDVQAQGQSSVTCYGKYDWMNNTMGQNPCLVAAILQSTCAKDNQWSVDPIVPPTLYPRPSGDDATPCRCNSVVYSLLSGCTRCQGYGDYLIWYWKDWTYGCSTNNTTPSGSWGRAIPNITAIPQWAFLDPVALSAGEFDIDAAQNQGDLPENTPIAPKPTPSPTSSNTRKGGSSATGTSSADQDNHHHIAILPIVLASVGGVLFLILVITLPLLFWRRHRRHVEAKVTAELNKIDENPMQLTDEEREIIRNKGIGTHWSHDSLTATDFTNRMSYFEHDIMSASGGSRSSTPRPSSVALMQTRSRPVSEFGANLSVSTPLLNFPEPGRGRPSSMSFRPISPTTTVSDGGRTDKVSLGRPLSWVSERETSTPVPVHFDERTIQPMIANPQTTPAVPSPDPTSDTKST